MNDLSAPMPPLRVLEVLGNAITGGMELYVANLLDNAPSWLEPTIVVPFSSRITERWIAAGYPLHFAPVDDEAGAVASVARLVELARRTGADLIHSHLANANTVASIASALYGIPAVATLHGQQLTLRDLETMHLGRAHGLVVCESALSQALLFGIPAHRITWIPNGVDIERFTPRRAERSDASLTIGFVGRLSWEKGPLEFVRLASLLGERYPKLRFAIIGDGPLRPAVEKEIARSIAAPKFTLHGVVDDMPAAFRDLDIVVSTSKTEGSPFALLEAMASGLPIVASRVGGVPEIVCDGVTGYLPPLSAMDQFVDAIGELVESPRRRAVMGAAGRDRAVRLFSAAERIADVTSLLARVARTAHGTQCAASIECVVGDAKWKREPVRSS